MAKSASSESVESRKNLDLRAGDTVRVWQKIVEDVERGKNKDKNKEGGKVRLQAFEGLVLARKHGTEPGATFTVRRVASGVGVERIFPLFSPMIDRIELVKRTRVRRAKLYYIRDKVAREARRQLRRTRVLTQGEKASEASGVAIIPEIPIEAASGVETKNG